MKHTPVDIKKAAEAGIEGANADIRDAFAGGDTPDSQIASLIGSHLTAKIRERFIAYTLQRFVSTVGIKDGNEAMVKEWMKENNERLDAKVKELFPDSALDAMVVIDKEKKTKN